MCESTTAGVSADAAPERTLTVRRLGRVEYDAATELQRRLVEERRAGVIGDTLLLLEHPPVITLGVRARGRPTHVVASPAELAEAGVTIHDSGRGGDVTYHGPGQLVGYPILDLRPDRCDVHRYVRDLEAVLMLASAIFGVATSRVCGLTGVWAGPVGSEAKVAAIGVRISRWISSHGFALNVGTDLGHFRLIVPCGIAGRAVTSLEALTGRFLPMAEVEAAVVDAFASVFSARVVPGGG
jgi:lipoyl(octanoyl) transferase